MRISVVVSGHQFGKAGTLIDPVDFALRAKFQKILQPTLIRVEEPSKTPFKLVHLSNPEELAARQVRHATHLEGENYAIEGHFGR